MKNAKKKIQNINYPKEAASACVVKAFSSLCCLVEKYHKKLE